jgi:electron transfer flavoprotein alpha subunit
MSSGILVFCETDGGKLKKTALELLSKAATLGGEVSAVVIGGSVDAAEAGRHGAATVYTVNGDAFGAYATDAWVKALAAVINKVSPAVVLGGASPIGKDLFPRLGARLGVGSVTEVTELANVGGQVVARRPVYAGKAIATVKVKSSVALFTVRPNSFAVNPTGGGAASVVAVDAGVSASDLKTQVIEVRKSAQATVDLTEADRIVSGGRSLKSAEGYDSVIRPLAAALRATPGASRAAVDAGYAPHSHQVGQTGKVVNPTLYIAVGISGAIQHLAGMRTSKVIVSINKDPEAPIFQHSSYGIVDDLFTICPALQKEFEAVIG